MTRLRALVRHYPAIAATIVAMALFLRVVVPAGFMPSVDGNGRMIISVCSGYGPMTMAMPGMAHHDSDGDTAKSPCAFADLALPVVGGADPIQVAAAIRYLLAISLVLVVVQRVQAATRLRPPLRGPPLSF